MPQSPIPYLPFEQFSAAARAVLAYLRPQGLACWLLLQHGRNGIQIVELEGSWPGLERGDRIDAEAPLWQRLLVREAAQLAADERYTLGTETVAAALAVPLLRADGTALGALVALDRVPASDAALLPQAICCTRLLASLFEADQRVLTQMELAIWAEEAEAQLQDFTQQLMARVRELACLYEIDQLGLHESLGVDELLEQALPLLPAAWSHPERVAVQILFDGRTFSSDGFCVSDCCLRAPLWIDRHRIGTIRVCYRRRSPDEAGCSFTPEERALLGSVAIRLSDMLQRRHDERLLRDQHWRLQCIIDGTHLGTWEWDVQSGALRVNHLWAEIVGYRLEELAPISIATWETLVHPEDLERSRTELDRHFSGELAYYDLELRMRHREGYWVWVHDRGKVSSWNERHEPLMMFGTHQDITARKETEQALRESEERFAELSRRDGLTGLLNRRGWNECIQAEERRARRYGHPACVLIADLDGLKRVNDEQGHQAGDQLIQRAARALQAAVRDIDQVARIGGDEFAVLAVECTPAHQQHLLVRMEQVLHTAGIEVSWGVAECMLGDQLSDTVAEADRRMYAMKAEHHRQRGACH